MMKSSFRSGKKLYRVRFKCEVQVIEYNQSGFDGECEAGEEEWEDDITARATVNQSKPQLTLEKTDEQTTKIASSLCIMAILVVVLYKWWTVVVQT